MIKTRTTAVVVALATAVTLAGCSSGSGGGSSVSRSQLEAKIKSEPQVKALQQEAGGKINVNEFVSCVAAAFQKDANPTELKEFVDGKISIGKVKPKSSASKSDATATFKSCAKNRVKAGG